MRWDNLRIEEDAGSRLPGYRPWLIAPTALFNLLGLPVTEVPLGLNEAGLPLGVQVVAGRDRDHVSIAVAAELERAFGGWVPPPG